MDKKTLKEYKDTVAMIGEWKHQLIELKKENIVQDVVKSSMTEFPFAESHATVEGYSETLQSKKLRIELEERIIKAERVKEAVDEWYNTLTLRQQRIIQYKVFEGMTWRQVADKMGRYATENSIRVEYSRIFQQK